MNGAKHGLYMGIPPFVQPTGATAMSAGRPGRVGEARAPAGQFQARNNTREKSSSAPTGFQTSGGGSSCERVPGVNCSV